MAAGYLYSIIEATDKYGTRTVIFPCGSRVVFYDITQKPCAFCGRRNVDSVTTEIACDECKKNYIREKE